MVFRSPKEQRYLMDAALKQIEKALAELEGDGKDLSRLKIKKFQKTHHANCRCHKCEHAKKKNDPRLRGILEDGYKIFIMGEDEEVI